MQEKLEAKSIADTAQSEHSEHRLGFFVMLKMLDSVKGITTPVVMPFTLSRR